MFFKTKSKKNILSKITEFYLFSSTPLYITDMILIGFFSYSLLYLKSILSKSTTNYYIQSLTKKKYNVIYKTKRFFPF